jgi:hypothetical protein
MPRPENANRPEDERVKSQGRTTAMIGLLIAATLGVSAWFALNRAADAGIARLARIDKVRAVCDSGWSTARDQRDSMRVDLISLPDTIDAGSSAELSRCANLRPNGMPTARAANPRDMTGPPPSERRP